MTIDQKTKYIFIEDKGKKADIGFVPGRSKTPNEAVDKAFELYSKKLVPKLIVTGGYNSTADIVEAKVLKGQLVKLGVPKQDILVEDKSTNTYENVIFSLAVIQKEIGLKNIKSITAIVRNYHARRVLMTLKKSIPPQINLKAPYNTKHYPFIKQDWFKTEVGRAKVE